jgi:small subunit ribosomal protein S17
MRKSRTGSVVNTRMDKTAVVEMVWKQRHRLYRKQVRRVTRFYVHDPNNQCEVGDIVRIQETRPISKTKHWRLMEVLQRRLVADVRPIELEAEFEAELEEITAPEQPVMEPATEEDDTVSEVESEE